MSKLRMLFICLAAGFALFYADARSPAPVPASAPADQFAAGRALVDIAVMAQVPHPIGSPANAQVRDYLIRRMTALGLSPTVQSDEGRVDQSLGGATYIAGGQVENIVGVLPGRDRALPALALMAHYDSVPGSPGAADDITGVASELEILRAIEASGAPARDVMLVFTDGEEAGLLGASAFFADNPLARHVGFIMNLESRGGGGRAAMFETGADNGGAIDLYRRTAVKPDANSLLAFVYKHLPNDTDYTIAKAKGVPGLNYAFIGRQFDYHSPSSTVAALDQGSVQHIGEQVLGTARALAFSPTLPKPAPDAVYGQAPGGFMLAYPAWGGWALLIVIAGLIAVAAFGARRGEDWSWADVARGAGAGLLLLVGGAAALHLARHATGYGFGWMAGRPLLARFAFYEVLMAVVGLGVLMLVALGLARGPMRVAAAILALAIGAASSLFGGLDLVGLGEGGAAAVLALLLFGKPAKLSSGWIGVLALGLVAALALQIWAPTAALTIAWPLAVGAACAALLAMPIGGRPLALILAMVLTALTLAWLGGLFHNLLQGLDLPELPALVVWMAAFCLWPLVQPEDGQGGAIALAPGAALLAGGLAFALALNFTDPYSPRHPEAVMPLYVFDQDGGRTWRVSPYKPNSWVRMVLGDDGGAIQRRALPTYRGPVWAAPAKPVPVIVPQVSLSKGPDGAVTLHLRADGEQTADLSLTIGAAIHGATLNGKPIALPAKPNTPIFILWAPSTTGLTLTFQPSGPGQAHLGYAVYRHEWPADAKPLPPLPPAMMAWDRFGATVVTGTLATRW
ncbi:MAG TPA: M20/M25/M40 family metallo-hydrolase [Caulobacteraceae bacterium]|nr:M20/M25/M40 family metallo-hydrolase [Caulobacteraceae bacterium]